MTWILTHSGKKFSLVDPQPEDVVLEDIAHALSLICRYGGHTKDFYSVAQHSVHVANAVSDHAHLPSLNERRWALLHDAAEAYVGDMVQPLKDIVPGFAAVEHRVLRVILDRFGVTGDMPEIVKYYDAVVLSNEVRDLMPVPPPDWRLPSPLQNLNITAWRSTGAFEVFMLAADRMLP